MSNYEGPFSPLGNIKTNDFKTYINSGGISKQEDLSQTIKGISERIARAQEIKGCLTLNNMNSYGKSWKTPALDTKMKNIHGGQTMQRFYTKFPFYRERGHSPPNVEDDLEQVLKETLAMPT